VINGLVASSQQQQSVHLAKRLVANQLFAAVV